MDKEDFAKNVMGIDPRVCLIEEAEGLIRRWLGDLPPDLAASITNGHLERLFGRVESLLRRGRYDLLDKPLADFSTGLADAVRWEREHGSLKPVTVSSELERCLSRLSAYLYGGGAEIDALRTLIRDGERFTEIGWWKITLSSGREIGRGEIRDANRSRLRTDDRSWYRQFVSDERVRDAEEAEKLEAIERARPYTDFCGPNVKPMLAPSIVRSR